MPGLTATMARLDPNLPVDGLKTLEQQVRENVFLDRMISTLAAAFAVLATMLAGIGLYGVLAYTVAQRTREIGVRMALGADAAGSARWCCGRSAVMTAIGGVFGLAAAFGLGAAGAVAALSDGRAAIRWCSRWPRSSWCWWRSPRATCPPPAPRRSIRCWRCAMSDTRIDLDYAEIIIRRLRR